MGWTIDFRAAAMAAVACAIAAPAMAAETQSARADAGQIPRGQYLVSIAGCSDCHTPGGMLGSPDMKRYLGGADVGFSIPGQGVFVGGNLTPDPESGLGKWTGDQIVTAIRKGKRPDGSELSGVMPSASFANLTDDDAYAIAAFLKSLPPVRNTIVSYKSGQTVPIAVSAVLPPEVYNALPASQR
ncbi:cbb3-type cytochrome c oxidase subunit III [Roseiarcus fermentans]|uniref:Cbb3-type cytochrome c oxidase subunit III n=1 Tax=Roseiarcus fermentans TaxID=1473586 RepID=A0A366FDS8_9HYPH|nr:cbb3-type cytochrome c oxidase subunit III [Roseiarcus fermentans]